MIWFNLKKLENSFITGQFSEKDGYNYVLVNVIYGIVYSIYLSMSGFNTDLLINAIISLIVTLIFLPLIFETNSMGDNKDFIKRFIAISWVVRVWIILFSIAITALFMLIFNNNDNSYLRKTISWLSTAFINTYNYYLINQSIRKISVKNE